MVRASNIFEDILPDSKVAMNRMVSLSERQILHTYIRSILIKRGDGEEVAFNDKKPELLNILSYLKILEINPYHYSRITDNHMKTLADNFVMFRSCYPIRVENRTGNVACATDDIKTNVRIYSMSVYDELANVMNDNTTGIIKAVSEVWREVMFYTYIREEILKRKLCPHFPFLHAYYITDNSSIDFDKMKGIKKAINSMHPDGRYTNDVFRQEMAKDGIDAYVSTEDGYNFTVNLNKVPIKKETNVIRFNERAYRNSRLQTSEHLLYNGKELDINARSTRCLVAITEAPDINIIDWSTRTYVIEDKPGRAQVHTGSHSDLTWKSVIFQIYIAFLTMVSKRILIREFSWAKNIYIKTLNDSGPIGFWKYNVRQIPFYIPNMKALVMFDSSFDQIQNGFIRSLNNFEFRLLGDCFPTIPTTRGMITYMTHEVSERLYQEMFNEIFDTNIFTTAFKTYGGIRPGPDIIQLMDSIRRESNDIFTNGAGGFQTPEYVISKLVEVLLTNFGFFLHNKMGLMVEQVDSAQLFETGHNINECKKGDLVAVNIGTATMEKYVWGTYISSPRGAGQHNILIKDPNTGIFSINQYSRNQLKRVFGTIPQQTKMDTKIGSEDELLETYNVHV